MRRGVHDHLLFASTPTYPCMSRVVEAIHHIVAAGVVPQMHYLPSLTRLPIKKTRNNNPIVVPSKERIYIDTYLKRVIFSLTYSYYSFVGHCHVLHLVSQRDKGIDVDIFPSSENGDVRQARPRFMSAATSIMTRNLIQKRSSANYD